MESELVTRKHLGHVFIDCLRQNPEAVCQIDAATGEEETKKSVLFRSIRLAKCFRKFGLQPGDVLSLAGRNHLDLHIPFYAALLNGLPISGIDPYFKFHEIRALLKITRPKIAFCQQESYEDYVRALKEIGLDSKVITFDGEENNLQQFIESYSEVEENFSEFEPTAIDPDKVFAYLISTSGTTGGLKVAAFTHHVIMHKLEFYKRSYVPSKDTSVRRKVLLLSPVQWVSGYIQAIVLPMLGYEKLQTSKPGDEDHIIEIINKYKPLSCFISPALLTALLQRKEEVDFTCFRSLNISGGKLYLDMLRQLRQVLPEDARILESYAQTETFGPVTITIPGTPLGSCGVPSPAYKIKLMDPESEKEIADPRVPGELCVKGPAFTEYYNEPQATKDAFTKDGYYKCGDLLYRDENNFYFFVDRIKSLIKYHSIPVFPGELEEVIQSHPGVRAVCVCGISSRQDEQRAAACVQLKPGCHVTEQEIKELVAGKLSPFKHLHGGVLFVDEMPMTSNGKIARGKVLELLNDSLQ